MKSNPSHILIVGPGALGTYFAARLGHKFPKVWVLDHRPARAAQLQERGFHVTGATALDWIPPDGHVGVSVRGWPVMDAIFVLTKAQAVTAAARSCKPAAGRGTWVVFLQNGWEGERDAIRLFPGGSVVLGVTEEGMTLKSAGHAFHAAIGRTTLDGGSRGGAPVARILSQAGFNAGVEKNFAHERWTKLILNACLNPLGALADVPNGRLAQPPLDGILDEVAAECARLSAAAGRPFPFAALRRRLREVAQRTAANRNSLWQDLVRSRPTERRYLTGPFLDIAKRRRVEAPLLLFLDRLLRRAEESGKTGRDAG